MSSAEAREFIERMTQWDQQPVLTSAEVTFLLLQSRLPSAPFQAGVNTGQLIPNQPIPSNPPTQNIPPDAYAEWQASTAYVLNALVVPFPRNGHYYKATVAGTSGAAQPAFPTTAAGTVVDGTVTWQEVGQALWVPTYNLAYAVALGWELKLGKVAGLYDFESDDQAYKRSQVYRHCQAMVKEWKGKTAGTICVQSSTREYQHVAGTLSNAGDDWSDCDGYSSHYGLDSGGGEFPWRDY